MQNKILIWFINNTKQILTELIFLYNVQKIYIGTIA